MNYNVLRFDGNTTVRAKHIKTVVDFVKPDIIILQEIEHQNGMDLLLSNVFNIDDTSFAAAPLPSTQWMKNGIIYNKAKLDLTSHKFVSTVLRDIPGYTLSIKNAHSNVSPLTIFAAHLKASDSLDDSDVKKITSTMALKKLATPEDVANSIVMLASNKLSNHVTGQIIEIAGGMEGRLITGTK